MRRTRESYMSQITFSDRERYILRLRWGLQDGRPHSLREIASKLGVTPERIRQIEAGSLRKLRHPSRSKLLDDFFAPSDRPPLAISGTEAGRTVAVLGEPHSEVVA